VSVQRGLQQADIAPVRAQAATAEIIRCNHFSSQIGGIACVLVHEVDPAHGRNGTPAVLIVSQKIIGEETV